MTQVKLHNPQAADAAPTPSKQIIAGATQPIEVTDSAGRRITLVKAKPLQKLRFIAAMGANSSNQLWVGTVGALMHVSSIDGAAVNTPATLGEIEALYQRLDEHGMDAVYEGVAQLSGEGADKDEAKK